MRFDIIFSIKFYTLPHSIEKTNGNWLEAFYLSRPSLKMYLIYFYCPQKSEMNSLTFCHDQVTQKDL